MLPIVLHALAVQTMPHFEVLVTDNSPDKMTQYKNDEIVELLQDGRFRHYVTASANCYRAADLAAKEAHGEFLCFPSDDSYYVPRFAEIMLKAAEANRWDLVYSNMVYDPRFNGRHYAAINVLPMLNSIDKTGFILKRSWFEGFSQSDKADGELIESLVARGIRHGKVNDILMVHN